MLSLSQLRLRFVIVRSCIPRGQTAVVPRSARDSSVRTKQRHSSATSSTRQEGALVQRHPPAGADTSEGVCSRGVELGGPVAPVCGPLFLLHHPGLLGVELGPVLAGDLHRVVLRKLVFDVSATEEATHLRKGEQADWHSASTALTPASPPPRAARPTGPDSTLSHSVGAADCA